MSVELKRFLSDLEAALGWPYRSPGSTAADASSGIDCSGMPVRAFRLQGEKLYHGSNGIWRSFLSEKGRLTDDSQLKPGYAVFKWKKDGAPARYTDGLGNFHHIGVVLSTDPLRIIQASSVYGCVKIDESLKGWTHWGAFKAVNYDNADSSTSNEKAATVYAENGGPVNLRKSPDRHAALRDRIPSGSAVTLLEEGDWCCVRWKKKEGYVMKEFIREVTRNG